MQYICYIPNQVNLMPLVLILKSYVKIYPGWIDKAVLLPLVKSVFSYKMKEQEIKAFLGNASLKAMVSVHTYFYVCVSENENQFIFFHFSYSIWVWK